LGKKVSGVRFQVSAWPSTSSLIAEKTLKKRITNIEQGITNIEVRQSIIIIFEKRLSAAIPHFIIRHFLFGILRFVLSY